MKFKVAKGFPSRSGDGTSLQEDPSCLEYNETHNCSIVSRSSDHPERNQIEILLMRILT